MVFFIVPQQGFIMIVTATQIRLKGIIGFLRFFPRVIRIKRQLSNIDGLIFMKFNGLCTLTGWDSHDDMLAFRNSSHHLDAMKNIKFIGKTRSVTWESEGEPSWEEAKTKLNTATF